MPPCSCFFLSGTPGKFKAENWSSETVAEFYIQEIISQGTLSPDISECYYHRSGPFP